MANANISINTSQLPSASSANSQGSLSSAGTTPDQSTRNTVSSSAAKKSKTDTPSSNPNASDKNSNVDSNSGRSARKNDSDPASKASANKGSAGKGQASKGSASKGSASKESEGPAVAGKNAESVAKTGQDFLTTLTALLDDGATIEAQAVAIPSLAAPIVDAKKSEDTIDDIDEAAVEAVLQGMQFAATPQSATATPSVASGVVSDDTVDVSIVGLGARSSPSTTVLNSAPQELELVATTPSAPLGAASTLVEQLKETRKDTAESMSDGVSPATTTSASELRTSNGREVREQGTLDARVGTAKWTDELAARVSLLSQRDIHTASLRLSPEHLGPLEIQITVNKDQTSVWFGAAHAETRAALEQALPRLRELLSSQGLTLTDAGVFREPPRDQARGYQTQNGLTTDDNALRTDLDVRVKVSRSLLDAYA